MRQLVELKSIVANDETRKVTFWVEIDLGLLDTFLSRRNQEPLDPDVQEEDGIYHPLVVLWNRYKDSKLYKITSVSATRARRIRMAMQREPNLDKWREAIEVVNKAHFLTGGGKTKFKATFDWLLAEGKIDQLIKGRVKSSQWEKNEPSDN